MRNKKEQPQGLPTLLQDYRIEIIAIALVLLAIFLLVEPFEIRVTLWRWLGSLDDWAKTAVERLAFYARLITISDLIGFGLLLVVGAFLAWRLRYRFLKSTLLLASACPRCGSPLQRIHRRRCEHFLEWLLRLELRRYHCTSPGCGWSGLRRRPHSLHPSRRPPVDEIEPDSLRHAGR